MVSGSKLLRRGYFEALTIYSAVYYLLTESACAAAQAAIDSCPVSCIHWVQKEELAALEWVMQCHMVARVNVGMMMCGQGGGGQDVFATTASYMKKRQAKYAAQRCKLAPDMNRMHVEQTCCVKQRRQRLHEGSLDQVCRTCTQQLQQLQCRLHTPVLSSSSLSAELPACVGLH